MCIQLAGLPTADNSRLHNIHMITCSNKCSVLDMTPPLVEDFLMLESHGVIAYDAFLDEEVLVIAPIMCIICDNPRAAELMNHSGPSAKRFCRMCMVSIIIKFTIV